MEYYRGIRFLNKPTKKWNSAKLAFLLAVSILILFCAAVSTKATKPEKVDVCLVAVFLNRPDGTNLARICKDNKTSETFVDISEGAVASEELLTVEAWRKIVDGYVPCSGKRRSTGP